MNDRAQGHIKRRQDEVHSLELTLAIHQVHDEERIHGLVGNTRRHWDAHEAARHNWLRRQKQVELGNRVASGLRIHLVEGGWINEELD